MTPGQNMQLSLPLEYPLVPVPSRLAASQQETSLPLSKLDRGLTEAESIECSLTDVRLGADDPGGAGSGPPAAPGPHHSNDPDNPRQNHIADDVAQRVAVPNDPSNRWFSWRKLFAFAGAAVVPGSRVRILEKTPHKQALESWPP
jgi:hypothetical protein